ncbi:TIGR02996 domain-containing protein [Telmatocola sphagniphila]|uniref:TIGR02996 domain-containing protein n=1 Tax=Telmatocola sphagniphila TaxID=1123043 RepID=A0A8E6ES57_9BACT|nr:TIGR02996 domain-containing protein [Telmatocola sphagniphila]QVL30199.1 TIGR02996 domain-containing protein [Telmatocola sphagniphila]
MNPTQQEIDRAAFIRKIRENPFDETRRLIFADWLEEHQPEQTNWIRQIRACSEEVFEQDLVLGDQRFMIQLRNGMCCELSMECDDFMKHAKQIFELYPIIQVTLIDKTPAADRFEHERGEPRFGWDATSVGYSCFIPNEIFELMDKPPGWVRTDYPFFDSKKIAIAALSRACVEYGREQAGLPKLEWPKVDL